MRGSSLLVATILTALTAGLFAPARALAQNREKSYELTIFGGDEIFDSDLDLRDAFYFGSRFGINFSRHYELELTAGFASSRHSVLPNQGHTDLFEADTNLTFNFPGRTDVTWRWVPYLTLGVGMHSLDYQDFKGREDETFNYGGGVRWFGTEKIGVRLDARGVTDFDGAFSNFQMTAGLSIVSGGKLKDSDGDTVPDSRDHCPNTPMGCKVDPDGCPRDGDSDGVCDGVDQCPTTKVGCKVDTRGCAMDSDSDGVCDGVDQCPGTPAGCRVDVRGCPSDADGDGVCDGVDRCANTMRGCRVDASGCPTDSDGDGVCDGVDRCPNTPRGVRVDATGCEVELVIQNVQFDFDKAVVKPEFQPILAKVAKALRDNPMMRIALHGHTDSISTEAYNLRLSQRRGDAVKKWLVEKEGIAADRLEVVAHGECCPVASNQTEEGRYKNRRVEFKRIR